MFTKWSNNSGVRCSEQRFLTKSFSFVESTFCSSSFKSWDERISDRRRVVSENIKINKIINNYNVIILAGYKRWNVRAKNGLTIKPKCVVISQAFWEILLQWMFEIWTKFHTAPFSSWLTRTKIDRPLLLYKHFRSFDQLVCAP